MTLSSQDRLDIVDLINLHGHLADSAGGDDAGDLFTDEVDYDVTDFGLGVIHGLPALRQIIEDRPGNQPIGHHVTNVVITAIDDHSARIRSKGIGIMADGSSHSATYHDVVVRQPTGWKINHRKIQARRDSEEVQTPRRVLDQYRQAAIDQSIEAMRQLYAADAIHEFPFTRPGMPSRLDGRDEILGFIAQSWSTGLLKYHSYRTIAVHDTSALQTIIVEQEVVGTSSTTGDFVLPNIVVLTTRTGKITMYRDYVNVLAAAAAIGREL